ncbi:peptidoglycan editing factor PgeF [Photobacterium sp. GJ3]|uniref:peptidoglycan editing factor PgeF n=1 Tax=Photobacterium sp. GJ3 TaxID=2829502 RepID=UPI001B8D75D2|nr:peptidoglycan editing factor PgeF [Photobacterium sp. GJ3]QUJ66946.1 peptidoglycan editing factor PgeF [Photobacterium sp. GJ3]
MWITPDWPAPAHVKAMSTTRSGGISQGSYEGLNLGDHVGDEPAAVAHNRQWLQQQLGLVHAPAWLTQTHSTIVLDLHGPLSPAPNADASVTRESGIACTVMTADCLPVLLCDRQGTQVGAVHAGWRGLADGILEKTVRTFSAEPNQMLAWLGPAIGPAAFEVGGEVRERFVSEQPDAASAFTPKGEKWLADLYLLARLRLQRAGITQIFGGTECTYADPARFYSYRRDGVTGRQASLIWLSQ